jgi:hypothetical protein
MVKPVIIMKRKQLKDEEDDWSDQGEDVRDDMDEDEEEQVKKAKLEHPFMRLARRLAAAHGVQLYHGMSLARQQDPQSYRHYKRSGAAPKIKKAAPDDVAQAFGAAVDAWVAGYGGSRCEAMSAIRKVAPHLWQRFRR